jgi:hypothetical protein
MGFEICLGPGSRTYLHRRLCLTVTSCPWPYRGLGLSDSHYHHHTAVDECSSRPTVARSTYRATGAGAVCLPLQLQLHRTFEFQIAGGGRVL